MELQTLLRDHQGESVSGENLEYEPVFTDMELAAQPGEEQQMGDSVIPAEDPDFRDLAEKATAVLENSHDIRAAVYLAWARLSFDGLPGFADAVGYIRGCLTDYWDTCHPELDEDDDNDPTMRVNAVQALGDRATVVRALRNVPLTDSRGFGRISLRQIEAATGEIDKPADMEFVPDTASIGAAFNDSDEEWLAQQLSAAKGALDDIKVIGGVFSDKTPGFGPDLDMLERNLSDIVRKLSDASGVADADTVEDVPADSAVPAPAAGGGAPGSITSPDDVTRELDRIIDYYRRFERSSPVPLMLERAKRLVNADFMTIMKDMAPSGMDNVRVIGGLPDEDDY
ncbi:type VI secretion system protein TssA [Qingshengfaniella alkalisoli]|uniref:Type VI secretion system protein TssA n=1 Tax=Qingshengfaniella alkalisoli TaxID=2599296 RepID=A0A5B8IYZ4_9RHOB|nr:type VI secretion system protein TssA [Qingshengfaniella alkalisoli]QDY70934.1 type VI secretion system protein TssA [Qingshengfaniella alkalisoli]